MILISAAAGKAPLQVHRASSGGLQSPTLCVRRAAHSTDDVTQILENCACTVAHRVRGTKISLCGSARTASLDQPAAENRREDGKDRRSHFQTVAVYRTAVELATVILPGTVLTLAAH